MKILRIIFVIFFSISLHANELDSIQLILPISYGRNAGIGQNTISKSGIWLGNKLGMVNIQERVNVALNPYRSDLAPYYKAPNDLNAFVNTLVQEANQKIIHNDGLTDAEAIKTFQFFGERLVGNIFDRILTEKGNISQARRNIWTQSTA